MNTQGLPDYLESLAPDGDTAYQRIQNSLRNHEMPLISVPPEVGRLLTLLVRVSGAQRILEVGALGGFSGYCLLRGTIPDNGTAVRMHTVTSGTEVTGQVTGHLTSLELNPDFAAVAQTNLRHLGYGEQVTYEIGPATESMKRLMAEGQRFDFVFIDADKGNYPAYLDLAAQLTHPGGLVVADNVLRGGRVWDLGDTAPSTAALRAFNEQLMRDPRLEAIIVPSGDGVAIARRR